MKDWPTSRVRIRGRWWRIVVKRLAPVKSENGWAPLHGVCCYLTKTIFLNPQFDVEQTLRHEITHACQPDLDEATVEEIEDAHVNADKVLKKLLQKVNNRVKSQK
jgi:hypothetical protein